MSLFGPSIPQQSLEVQKGILAELKEIGELLEVALPTIFTELQSQTVLLKQIAAALLPEPITNFTIAQEKPMLTISPGNSPVFTATPVPATSVPSTPPTWVSSDTANAPITVDATGLVATVALPASAVVGTVFTLTISYTNADGTVATGSTTQTIVPAPSPDITSFTIAQTT